MMPYCWKYSVRGGEEGNREKFVKKDKDIRDIQEKGRSKKGRNRMSSKKVKSVS